MNNRINIKSTKELNNIKYLINKNRFCLTPLLSDIEILNTDNLENIATNLKNEDIKIISIEKEIRNYRIKHYKINLNIKINESNYNIVNWFIYDKYKNIFEDEEVFADNE